MAQGPLIAAAHDQGKEVHVWTVNEPVDISTMIDRGVDNIITDDPAAAVKVLKARAALSNAERLLLRFKSLYVN
jgi:glycerophosphoryl diester phosphodiesterase